MSKALSRNNRGSDYDMRKSVRRPDQNLGDWLDETIRDEADDHDEDDVPDDRLEAATRRLARASEPRDAGRHQRRRWRDEAIEEVDRSDRRRQDEPRNDDEDRNDRYGRVAREPVIDPKAIVDDAAAIFERRISESERHTAHALNNLANLIKRGQRPNDGEGESVKRALETFAHHAEQSERKTARALNDIAGILETGQRERAEAESGIVTLAERLARIESRLSEQPGAGAAVRPIRSALARLESRIDRISSEDRTAEFENALSGLDNRLADIARRLDEDARQREEREAEERARRERESLERASASASHDDDGGSTPQRMPPSRTARRPLVDAIAEITQRQRALEEATVSEPVAAPAPDRSDALERLASLQDMIDSVSRHLDGVREVTGEHADQQLVAMRQIESLRREVQEVAHTVGQLAPRASISAVEDALRDLSFRLDSQRDYGVAEQLLAPAERIASELRAVLRELDPGPIVRNLHEDVLTIGRRLDAMQVELQQVGNYDGGALRALADHTQEIKYRLDELTSRPLPLEKIETRLFDLTQRVDALSLNAGSSAADMVDVVKSIRSIVANEMARGLDTFNHRLETIAGKFDEAVTRIGGRRFDELGAKIDEIGKSLADRIDRGAKPIDHDLLAGKINETLARTGEKHVDELSARIEELGHALASRIERNTPKPLDPAQLAGTINEAVTRGGARKFDELGARIDEVGKSLAQRIERSVQKPLDPAQLAGTIDQAVMRSGARKFDELGARIDEVGKSLAQHIDRSAPKPVDTSSLEQLVAKLAKKIDHAIDGKPHAQGFEEIGRKIDRLETRLEAAPGESFARIEALLARPALDRQFAELAQGIDLVQKALASRLEHGVGPSETADVRYIEELVRGLDQKIDAALRADGRQPDIQAIERQLAHLAHKIDRLDDSSANGRLGALQASPAQNPQLDLIAERLERMQAALAERVNESARVEARQSDLANLVENLAARVDQALDPKADAEAFKSLETQIGALTKRLDRTSENGAALSAIEARIGELVARIEDTRLATTQAAEEAVRRATQDILREAAAVGPAEMRGEIEREISDLRKNQDESGQRTHETLLAVHETLERVVDRLAVFEDELSDIRSAPSAPVMQPAANSTMASVMSAEPPSSKSAPIAPAAPQLREREAPIVAPATRDLRLDVADDDDLMDFLLPPGGAAAPRRDTGQDPSAARSDKQSLQSDFIAAARRAAQQAAAEAEAAELAQQARRVQKSAPKAAAKSSGNAAASKTASAVSSAASARTDEDTTGGLARVGAVIQERKRPLLIGLAALVMLVGSYEIARFALKGAPDQIEEQHGEAEEPSERAVEPAEKSANGAAKDGSREASPAAAETAPAAPAAKEPVLAPLPRFIPPAKAPKAEASPTDPAPTGSIGAAPLATGDAIGAIKAAASNGEPAAQFEYGARLAEGRGVTRDPKAAAQWFEKAAAQGLAPAQYRLGSLYEKGLGVERSYSAARKWYRIAAEAGNARAMHNLAVLLAEGGDDKPDYGAATQWFQKAADFGVRDSQYNLAILYARGLGVSQNLQQSYLWFSAAADQGDEDAGKKRDEVGARLASKELAAAKALASGFKAKAPLREANDVLPPPGGWESLKDAGQPTSKPAAKSGAKARVSQI